MKISIFGCGAYGLALSSILTSNNFNFSMWTKFEEEKKQLDELRGNEKLLPGYKLAKNINITTSIEAAAKNTDLIIIAIPTEFIEDLIIELKPYINSNHILIASKGIQQKTGLFIHEIIKKHINTNQLSVISGPSFAKDVITKKPLGLSLATNNKSTAEIVKCALENHYVKLNMTSDILGVEMCGTIKNVMALSSGIINGLKANESTKAMFLTEALNCTKEILKYIKADPKTILSYAGIGDFLLTCTSSSSRNFSYGKLIGEKSSLEQLEQYIKDNTVEGMYSLISIYELLNKKNINMTLITIIYNIVINHHDPTEILSFLMES